MSHRRLTLRAALVAVLAFVVLVKFRQSRDEVPSRAVAIATSRTTPRATPRATGAVDAGSERHLPAQLRLALRAALCTTLALVVLVTVRQSSDEVPPTAVTVSSPRAGQPVDPAIERELLAREKSVSRSSARRAARPAPVAQRVVIERITWTSPLDGYRLTGRFGDRSYMWSSGMHTGLDFAAPSGTPIRSIAAGVVKHASYDGSYGYKTVVSLPGGGEVWYCHQDRLAVRKGQRLAPGEVLGYVGYTGNVTGAHLHLEVRHGDRPVDPAAVLAGHGVVL